jgi:serine/threonine protein kinase
MSSNNNSYRDKCIPILQDSTISTYFDIDNCILGSGGYGQVCKGKITEDGSELLQSFNIPKGVDIAIKKIKIYEFNMNEISILFKIKDLKYITKYYGCLYDDNYIYIIMEYIQGKDLYNYIINKHYNSNDEIIALNKQEQNELKSNRKRIFNNILSISKKIAIAIDELHKLEIIHNDIKPENIMVIENDKTDSSNNLDIKLIDYGLSCEVKNINKCKYGDGSIDYIDENQKNKYERLPINENFSDNANDMLKKKDWWAYIIIIFALIFNEYPDDFYKNGYLTKIDFYDTKEKLNFLNERQRLGVLNRKKNIKQKLIFLDNKQYIFLKKIILSLFNRGVFFDKTSDKIRNEIFTTLDIKQSDLNNISGRKNNRKNTRKNGWFRRLFRRRTRTNQITPI